MVSINPLSGKRRAYKERSSLEVYELVDGKYELMQPIALLPEGQMVWLEGVGLGVGCERNFLDGWKREWLYWYDRDGGRYPTAQERAAIAETLAEQASFAQRRAEAIADRANLEKQQAEAITEQERMIAEQERAEKIQERLAKEQAEMIADQANLAKEQAEQKAQRLAERLRALGLDPDEI
jgi:hypothetical protein